MLNINGRRLGLHYSPANWRAPGALWLFSLLQISLQQRGIRKPGEGALALCCCQQGDHQDKKLLTLPPPAMGWHPHVVVVVVIVV